MDPDNYPLVTKSWLLAVPLAGVVTAAVTWLTMETTLLSFLTTTGLMMLFIAAFAVFVLGPFLLNPVYSEKSMKFFVNIVIAVFVSIGLFLVSLIIFLGILMGDGAVGWLFDVQVVQTALCWLLGSVFLYLGKKRLSKME